MFNIEGVELNEDDLEYVKDEATLFASGGRNIEFFVFAVTKSIIFMIGEDFDSNSTFSEYNMVKELGEGGFGKVLLGVHRKTNEKVAIKIIKTNLIGRIILSFDC